LPVACPGVEGGHIGLAGGRVEAELGGEFVAFAGEVDDSHVGVGLCGGAGERGEEELGEKGVCSSGLAEEIHCSSVVERGVKSSTVVEAQTAIQDRNENSAGR
jgi:hypothetical protein